MKKWFISFAITAIIALPACSSANNGLNPQNNDGNNTMNLSTRTEPGNAQNDRTSDDSRQNRFGFVRMQSAPDQNTHLDREDSVPALDLEQVANTISRITIRYPNIEDVATLVTDEEVLVSYRTDTDNRELTADQVKNTAAAVVPRYFHVYVTDNPDLLQDVARFQNLPPNKDVDNLLNETIEEMKRSTPQGRDLEKGENPNGEEKDDAGRHKTEGHE